MNRPAVRSMLHIGRQAHLALTLNDLQGASALQRLPQTVLSLDAHDPKTSTVYRTGGLHADVTHNRTALIAKARNGPGTRQRVAFRQDARGSLFADLRVIAPKGSGIGHQSGQPEVEEHWTNR